MVNTDHSRIWQCVHHKAINGEHVMLGRFKGIFIYDEEYGDEDEGFEPGTRFEDLPKNWCCPDCGATKDAFVEIV
jgi:rubredoxin